MRNATGESAGTRRCMLCNRVVRELTQHHLIPRARHRTKRNKRLFDRDVVRQEVVLLCHPCHKQIHAVLSEKELERAYHTLEALRAHPEIGRFANWIAKRPDGRNVRAYPARHRR